MRISSALVWIVFAIVALAVWFYVAIWALFDPWPALLSGVPVAALLTIGGIVALRKYMD
jgi:hypothetical protein